MRRYYDDEEEENEQQAAVTSEHLFGWDWLLAVLASVVVFVLLNVWAFPALSPDVWTDAAIASGVRAPSEIFPGTWRVLVKMVFFGNANAANVTSVLPLLGRLMGGLTAGVAFLFFRALLAQLVRLRLHTQARRLTVQRLAAWCGTLCLACSDPVWRLGQAFSPSSLLFFMTLLALFLFMLFLMNGRIWSALGAMFLGGVLAADTPYGFLVVAICWFGYAQAFKRGALCEDNPLLDEGAGQSARWLISFVWLVGLAVGIGINCMSFVHMGGLAATGKTVGDMPLMYLVGWWRNFIGVASPLGWVLALGVCVMPFGVSLLMLPRAVDEELRLPYHIGTLACFTGVLAFAQLAMLTPLWFWNWSGTVKIHSPFFLLLVILCAAGTLVCALAVFGVEACCRDHMSKQRRQFVGLSQNGRLAIFCVLAVLLMAGVVPGRMLKTTRVMLKIIEDYAQEVVAECGDAKMIFTDGSFDARYELLAAAQRKSLYAISLMAASDPYNQYLRLRPKFDTEDATAISTHAAAALRAWVRENQTKLNQVAVQQGFELWKRQGKPLPPSSGVLSRPMGMDEAARAKGIAAAQELSKRVLAVYAAGGLERAAGAYFCELFRFVQWRLARVARMRAESADHAGDVKTAEADTKLSEELDDCNSSLQQILADMEKARLTTLRQVTPREGLQLALARADFALAASYARPILKAIKDDPDANFGMAMSYYVQKQWARAEEHFKIYLTKRSNEPAVWNNLALACLQMKRYDEAEQHAKKALALIPESAEVMDTLKQIEQAKKAAAKPENAQDGKKRELSKQGAK